LREHDNFLGEGYGISLLFGETSVHFLLIFYIHW